MNKKIVIAVDAMGGDDAPKKIINGIIDNSKSNKNVFYKVFGDTNKIEKYISKELNKETFEIIHTDEKVLDTDTALSGAKKSKNTSMWLAINSVKE